MALADKNISPPQDYKQAELMINQAIAKMDEETHIEYNSSINREDTKPRRLKISRLLYKLLSNLQKTRR